MRFDLKFVLLRADLGLKIRDPKLAVNDRWIFSNTNPINKDNLALVISIGYPF